MTQANSDVTRHAGQSLEEARLVQALRDGDERVFVQLVREHGALMRRVASLYVRDQAVVDEVVQQAWLGVVTGIDRFEGRASFKTWLFRVLTNVARSRAAKEARTVPFSTLASAELESGEPSVEPERFFPHGDRWAGHWISSPRRFDELPEGRLEGAETIALVRQAIERLPAGQRTVITMRDIVGFTAEEVCATLDVSEANQRVLLHRARTAVRKALERHVDEALA